jgi:hypothetical protein
MSTLTSCRRGVWTKKSLATTPPPTNFSLQIMSCADHRGMASSTTRSAPTIAARLPAVLTCRAALRKLVIIAPDQSCAAYATSRSASPDGLLSATR